MQSNGGYPMGAANDKAAPYNEDLNVVHTVEVSVSLSYTAQISGPKDMSEEAIKLHIQEEIEDNIGLAFTDKVCIDDIAIIED